MLDSMRVLHQGRWVVQFVITDLAHEDLVAAHTAHQCTDAGILVGVTSHPASRGMPGQYD